MGRGCHEVVGERELAGAMRIAAFDEAGARKTSAKLGRVEFLLGRELLHAAAAVLAEHDNRHDFERRSLRQHVRGERNSESLNGNSKKDDGNGGSVHSTLLKHLVFSCRVGAVPVWNRTKRSIKLNHRVFCQCENKKAASRSKCFLANWFIFRTKSARSGAAGRHLE